MPFPNLCPIGGCERIDPANGYCEHFIGWTEDGRTIQPAPRLMYPADAAPRVVLESDRIVKTGVSARVYREAGIS